MDPCWERAEKAIWRGSVRETAMPDESLFVPIRTVSQYAVPSPQAACMRLLSDALVSGRTEDGRDGKHKLHKQLPNGSPSFLSPWSTRLDSARRTSARER